MPVKRIKQIGIMRAEEVLPKLSYRRFPLAVRIIASVLVVTFFAQDIVWAHPDPFVSKFTQNNKLAPKSIFKDPSTESIERYYSALLLEKIEKACEKIDRPVNRINFNSVKIVLKKLKPEPWMKIIDPEGDEVFAQFQSGNMLRFYDPDKMKISKYVSELIEEIPMPGGSLFGVQLLKVKAMPAPQQKKAFTPRPVKAIDPEIIKEFDSIVDADTMSKLIDTLEGRQRYGYEEYGDKFLRPLFELLFIKLRQDFANADEFIEECRMTMAGERPEISEGGPYVLREEMNKNLLGSFARITRKEETKEASIGLYGTLLYHLTRNKSYFEHLYDQFIATRPRSGLSFGKRGTSYYGRGDSIAAFYPSGILYGEDTNPYFTSRIRRFEPTSHSDRRGFENARKVRRALEIWENEANKRKDKGMLDRVANFKKATTVLEIDVKTNLFFADPQNNVVRLGHVEGRRHAMSLPKPCLAGMKENSELDMRRLATVFDFLQCLIDVSSRMLDEKMNTAAIQEARSIVTLSFLNNPEDFFVSMYDMRDWLSDLMKKDTLDIYADLALERFKMENEAMQFVALGKEKKNSDYFGAARNIYNRLFYRYEAAGMHSRANAAYNNMLMATTGLQLYDKGGDLPIRCELANTFTALRFGRRDDFKPSFRFLMTGRGLARNIERGEIETLKGYLTPSNEKHDGFEDDVQHALEAQLEAVGKKRLADLEREVNSLLADYFGKKDDKDARRTYLERAFGGLSLNEINYEYDIVSLEKAIVSDAEYSRETALEMDKKSEEIHSMIDQSGPRSTKRTCINAKGLQEIIDSLRRRTDLMGKGLLPQERAAIKQAIDDAGSLRVLEFDSVILRDGWVFGLNTSPRSENSRLDALASHLQALFEKDHPKTIFLSRDILDRIEKDEELLREYIFAVLISPYVSEPVSRYLRKYLFYNNCVYPRSGPYKEQHIRKLERLCGRLARYNRALLFLGKLGYAAKRQIAFLWRALFPPIGGLKIMPVYRGEKGLPGLLQTILRVSLPFPFLSFAQRSGRDQAVSIYEYKFPLGRQRLEGDGLGSVLIPASMKRNDGQTDVINGAGLVVKIYSNNGSAFKVDLNLTALLRCSFDHVAQSSTDTVGEAVRLSGDGLTAKIRDYFDKNYSDSEDKETAERFFTVIRNSVEKFLAQARDSYLQTHKIPRFGKVSNRQRRLEGERYFMVKGNRASYFRYRWNMFESLDDQIVNNLAEREWFTKTISDVKSVQNILVKVKGVKSEITDSENSEIKEKLDLMLDVINSKLIRLPNKQVAAGYINSAKGYYNSGKYDDMRMCWKSLQDASAYLEARKKDAEQIYRRLKGILNECRHWAIEANSRIAEATNSRNNAILHSVTSRDEMKMPGCEPELEGIGLLVWKGIKLFEDDRTGANKAKIDSVLKRAADEIRQANIMHNFMITFKNTYYDARYSRGGEVSAEEIFRSVWLKYLAKEGHIRGAPDYWYARLYQAAFIHQSIPNPEKLSQRISKPLFKAASIVCRILKLNDLDSILDARSLLKDEKFARTRALFGDFKTRNKRSGGKKESLADLLREEKLEIAKSIALVMGLDRNDTATLKKLFIEPEAKSSPPAAGLTIMPFARNKLIGMPLGFKIFYPFFRNIFLFAAKPGKGAKSNKGATNFSQRRSLLKKDWPKIFPELENLLSKNISRSNWTNYP